jgi:uncharacterized Zn-binding protein involved in type VI secretion
MGMPQARLGDKSMVPTDSHGCPACPHPCIGPAIQGSADVLVNNRPAVRVGDKGVHAPCCGSNMWEAAKGSTSVEINGKGAHRLLDKDEHCGGNGMMIEGSPDVIVGEGGGSGLLAIGAEFVQEYIVDPLQDGLPVQLQFDDEGNISVETTAKVELGPVTFEAKHEVKYDAATGEVSESASVKAGTDNFSAKASADDKGGLTMEAKAEAGDFSAEGKHDFEKGTTELKGGYESKFAEGEVGITSSEKGTTTSAYGKVKSEGGLAGDTSYAEAGVSHTEHADGTSETTGGVGAGVEVSGHDLGSDIGTPKKKD